MLELVFSCCSRAAAGPATRSPGPLFALAFTFAQPRPVCAPFSPTPQVSASLRSAPARSPSSVVPARPSSPPPVPPTAASTAPTSHRFVLAARPRPRPACFFPPEVLRHGVWCCDALGAHFGARGHAFAAPSGWLNFAAAIAHAHVFFWCHCLAYIYRSRWPAHPRSSWVSAPSRRRSAKAAKPHRHKIESLFAYNEINLEPLYPKALYSVRGPLREEHQDVGQSARRKDASSFFSGLGRARAAPNALAGRGWIATTAARRPQLRPSCSRRHRPASPRP